MRPFPSAVLLFAAALPAQTTSAPAAAHPHLLVDTVGPDGWRMRLGPTNLGSLLESEQGRELWQPQVLPIVGWWQQLVGDEAAFPAAKDRLLGYGGRVRVAAWFDDDSASGREIARLAVVLEHDGRTDMQALAADLRRLQREVPGEWGSAELGGQAVDVVREGEDAMTAPTPVGQSVVLALAHGGGLATAFAAAAALAGEATGKPPVPTTPALRLDLDVAALVAMAFGADDEEDRALRQILGVDSLGRVQLTVGSAGPQVMLEVAQHFLPAPRGLFAAFFPPTQGVSALQAVVPPGAGSWRLGHFDSRALFDTALAAVESMRSEGTRSVAAEMREELGLDVSADLLAHATDEVLAFGSPLQGLDRPTDFTWTLLVRLRDEKAFAQGLDTLLQHAKPFLSREETTTVEGVACSRYGNMLGYDLWFAVGRGTLLLAAGRDAEDLLGTTLKSLAAAPTPAPELARTAFADLGRHLPPGLNGLARGDIDSLFAVPIEWWAILLQELMPFPGDGPEDDPEARARTRELLQQHNLGTLRTATGHADGVWRWRTYW